MRDLTKSMISFSWAMSLFGVQQAANILSPRKTSQSFNNVTQAFKKEFGETTESGFRAGDTLQKGVVDLTFSMFSPQVFSPNTWIKMASDAARQTADALGHVLPGAPGPPSESTGWGPMPPSEK